MSVSKISILVNVLLSIFKFFAGIIAHSGAMLSDAIHSASDVFSTIVVMIGIKMSVKEADKEHPYGHERMESVAAIVLATVLLITAIGIGKTGIDKIVSANYKEIAIPGILALVAAIVSLIVKEAMFWYTKIHAKRINSGALMADAWHHRSDALSSVGAFAGILGARMGVAILDPIASVIICIFIGKAAYDIFRDAVDKMVDKKCDDEMEEKIKKVSLNQEGVLSVCSLKTRMFGNRIYVDIEIVADKEKTLEQAHEIADKVHDEIEKEFVEVKHIMVHVNPS
ncbi:MAG: cation diffusion facilitator family transporter [Eubacteriales bacterium]